MSNTAGPALDVDLPADLGGLQRGIAAIERHADAVGLPRPALARVLAVFEELFTNTMKYGYADKGGGRVHVVLSGGDPVRLVLEDTAPAFDPTAWDPTPDLAGDLSERPIGRVGIALVMGLARSVRWEPLSPGNRLVLELSGSA